MATKQGFYSRVHLYDNFTISVFQFHFLFPISISTVSNYPSPGVLKNLCDCVCICLHMCNNVSGYTAKTFSVNESYLFTHNVNWCMKIFSKDPAL